MANLMFDEIVEADFNLHFVTFNLDAKVIYICNLNSFGVVLALANIFFANLRRFRSWKS